MGRTTAIWFGLAGVLTLSGWVFFTVSEPVYYDATTLTDYVSVVGLTVSFVVTGIALILLWRHPPVTRGSLFLLLAGIGAIAVGAGDLLEDAFSIEAAVWVFFGGGLLMMVSLLGAGISALTVRSPERWAGLFLLLAVPGGLLGFGLVMMGVSWILFGLWIANQRRSYVWALAITALPALAYSIYLYGGDIAGAL